jgi:hypothetical protein
VLEAATGDWDDDICEDATAAWNEAHEAVFRIVPATPRGCGALVDYCFECVTRDGFDWETVMRTGYYNELDNHVADLLRSLVKFVSA